MHPRPCLGPPDPWFRVRARSRRSRPNQVDYWEGTLQLLFYKLCLKMTDHGSRSTWGPGPSRSGLRAQKICSAPTKTDLPYNFCFIKFSPSGTVEAVLQTLFRAPDPWFWVRARSRRSRPDKVYYWEGTLKFWFNKLCQKMIDHGSRSTRGPGPSRSGLWAQKHDLPPLKQDCPTTFA